MMLALVCNLIDLLLHEVMQFDTDRFDHDQLRIRLINNLNRVSSQHGQCSTIRTSGAITRHNVRMQHKYCHKHRRALEQAAGDLTSSTNPQIST